MAMSAQDHSHLKKQPAHLQKPLLNEHGQGSDFKRNSMQALQHALANPAHASADEITWLQQAAGNQAVNGLIQARLQVGPVGDAYEQQADRMADHVMGSPAPIVQPSGELSRARPGGSSGLSADDQTRQALTDQKGRGEPLPPSLLAEMETRFGADFSAVRIHTNDQAASLNQRLRAQAFTHQADIYFNSGFYRPGSPGGNHLLAHELTHVIQQRAAGTKGSQNQSSAEGIASLPSAHQTVQRHCGRPDCPDLEPERGWQAGSRAVPDDIKASISSDARKRAAEARKRQRAEERAPGFLARLFSGKETFKFKPDEMLHQ